MYEKICVTNRHLCKGDFLSKINEIAKKKSADKIILREKDLDECKYKELAKKVMEICRENKTTCILHNFYETAIELNANGLHLPLSVLETLPDYKIKEITAKFQYIGASCHSLSDAKKAQDLGCTYITAGHIFVTDCKKGLEPRGIGFLTEICKNTKIPVYAIGGINSENINTVINAGAKGACMMSGYM